jgi:peptide/nickel transport system permease protein
MQRFLIQRFFQSILALLFLSVVVFFMTWVTGDPVRYIRPPMETTEEEIELLRRELGLDKPLVVQYAIFLGRATRGDFGYALSEGRLSVTRVIKSRVVTTLHLGAMALVFTLIVALPLGVFAAYHRGTIVDTLARTLAFAGQSVPEFWLGIMLILLFVVYLNVLPAAGRSGGWDHWILPSVTAGWFSMAGLLRITRSSVLEVLGSDYIRTARAKGLRERSVLWRHTVRNSLITVITSVALLAVGLMNGIVLVETVFGWPGLGQLLAGSVLNRDLFVVQGLTLLIGTSFLVANFLADILYSIVDPRIRLA